MRAQTIAGIETGGTFTDLVRVDLGGGVSGTGTRRVLVPEHPGLLSALGMAESPRS